MPKNDKEALKWFEKAAGQGNPSALYNLAVCYVKGRGVRKDYIKAIELLRESEKKGKIYAADEAGAFVESLDNGHILEACGGQINTEAWSFGAARFPYIEIFEYLLNAAQMGNVKAQYQLALCYEYGQGTVRDYARAALWYSEAAKQGHTEAQYLLACCYSHGWGVPQNKAEAQRWYKKAASHGHLEAKRLLEKL